MIRGTLPLPTVCIVTWIPTEALVSQNLFAYSYYSGSERKTKMSLVHVDPASHLMTAVGDPVVALWQFQFWHASVRRVVRISLNVSSTVSAEVLSTGYNSLVGAVSLPAGPATPSTFTYIQPAGAKSIAKVGPEDVDVSEYIFSVSSVRKVCGVSSEGRISACKDVSWAEAVNALPNHSG